MTNIKQNQNIINSIESLDPFAIQENTLQYEYPNPFYLPVDGSPFKYIKKKLLEDEYKNVYILCLSDNYDISNNSKTKLFYNADTTISELMSQHDSIILLRGPFSLVYIRNISFGLVTVYKELLEPFNVKSYNLNDKELVYLMLETRESDVKSWLTIYESHNNLDNFIRLKIFGNYYKLDDDKFSDNLLSQINQVDDFKYWEDKKNCYLSIDNSFKNRKFNIMFVDKQKQSNDINNELSKLINNFEQNKNNVNTEYPTETNKPPKPKNKINGNENKINFYNSESKHIEDANLNKTNSAENNKPKYEIKSFFKLVNQDDLIIKQENIRELLIGHSLNEKEKYYLICNLLVSKIYCHYVLCDNDVLTANDKIFRKYKPAFRYLIGYAWVSLFMEEHIRKTRAKQTDRFVIDINTAAALPIFPFNIEFPYLNPYFCCMVSDDLMNTLKNINGVQLPFEYQNGIVDLNEFRQRLNLFISGNRHVDLLDGVNWTNMVITGGTMAAIIPKTNPLMLLFKKTISPTLKTSDNELDLFFQEYYTKSDIDIACNHTDVLDFIDHAVHLKDVVQTNLRSCFAEDAVVQIVPEKSLSIYINSALLKIKCDRKEIPLEYDYIIEHKNKHIVKLHFYDLYIEEKKKLNEKNKQILGEKINRDEYFEIIDYCKFEKTTIVINDMYDNDLDILNSNTKIKMMFVIKEKDTEEISKTNIFIKFTETLKYKLYSPQYIKHPFEIFRIGHPEFLSCISRFHLPCVRSYYTGTNCYLLPSAVTAYHTFTNINFRYFIGKVDPVSIIDKYRKRGYTTLLNKSEIDQYLSHIMVTEKHVKGYGIQNTKNVNCIVGSLDINHDFFKPRKNLPEDFVTNTSGSSPFHVLPKYSAVKFNNVSSINNFVEYYKKEYKNYFSEFIEKRTIAPTGQIEPLHRWMIDASYDLLK